MYEKEQELFKRYYKGEASEAEILLVEYWFHQMGETDEVNFSKEELAELTKDTGRKIDPAAGHFRLNRIWWQAVAILLISAGNG